MKPIQVIQQDTDYYINYGYRLVTWTIIACFYLLNDILFFSGCEYEGLRYEKGNCGVSIVRSGKIWFNYFCSKNWFSVRMSFHFQIMSQYKTRGSVKQMKQTWFI